MTRPAEQRQKKAKLTMAAAERQANAEGLRLVRSSSTASGFKGVRRNTNGKTYWAARDYHRRTEYIGCYKTIPEAALAYARHLGPASSEQAAARTAMTAKEAERQAEEEGLQLVTSSKAASGYACVRKNKGKYHLQVRVYGHQSSKGSLRPILGSYDSPAEAALAYARHLGPAASAQQAEWPRQAPEAGGTSTYV